MSLAIAQVKNRCSRKDGMLHINVLSAKLNKNAKQVYILMGNVVPYSVDAKKRKNSQNKKLAEHKDIAGDKIRTKSVPANPDAYWNESHSIHIQNLTTINLLQVECWSVKPLKKDSLLGVFQVPISNSYVSCSPKLNFSLHTLKDPEYIIGEFELKLKLEPYTPALEVISLNSEKLGNIPTFIFESFWLPRFMRELNLQDCQITEIPEDITKLSVLNVLNLSKNKIKEIPEFVSSMLELTIIDVSANQITTLPRFLCEMKLQTINVIDNPLEEIPEYFKNSEILQTNFVSIGNYQEEIK